MLARVLGMQAANDQRKAVGDAIHRVRFLKRLAMFLFPLEPECAIMARISITDDNVREVFAHWRKYHERAFAKPTYKLKEWMKIKLRFEEGYTVAQLCRAIDGIHKSPWHNGENPGNTRYVSLELCMRDTKHVEQFLEIANQPDAP